MPHKAFLKKKSLLDRFKDDYGGHTGYIQSARAEHTWSNPLTRRKRTNKLNGWIKSFAGKRHVHKLARFNAQQAGRNESYENVKLDCLRYADILELPNGVCVKVNATIRCPRRAAFVFRITGIYDAEPENPSKYVIRGFYPVYGLERKPSEEFDIPCNDVSDIEQWIKSNEKGNRMQNEAMSLKGFIENLTEKLTKQFDLDEDEVKNYLDSHTEEMQILLDNKDMSLKEKVLFVRSEITGEKDEAKKSESVPESDYIQEFRSWLDAQEGEQYNEQEITDFGWEWKSQDVGYPNGNKTYYDYFTMDDDGVTYRLEVAWNSFNETIVGNKIWQDSSEAKKSERLFNKREMERIALSEGSKVSPYLVEIAHKILKDEYGWKASTLEEVADWLGDHKQAFEHAYGQALRNSDDDKANVKAGIEAALDEEEQGVMNAEIAMMGESKKHEGFNTTRDLDNFALHILNYIKDKTHYPGYVRFVKLNDDEEDFYGKYFLSVNGKNYYLYVGDTDYSITDNNDENTLVEGSTDLSGAMNKDLDDFCERIQQPFYTESKEPAEEKLGYEKGHKNSKGEDAPWVIRSHKDNRVLASFPTKKEAEDQMQRMKQYSKSEARQPIGEVELANRLKKIDPEKGKYIIKAFHDIDGYWVWFPDRDSDTIETYGPGGARTLHEDTLSELIKAYKTQCRIIPPETTAEPTQESKKSESATTEEDAIRKAFKSIVEHVPANAKSNFDEEFVNENMEALLDLFNGWFEFDDGEFVTTVRVVDPDNENGDCYDEEDEAYQWNACYNVTEGIIDLLGWNYGEETVKQPIQDALFYDFIGTKYIDNSNESKISKKSEADEPEEIKNTRTKMDAAIGTPVDKLYPGDDGWQLIETTGFDNADKDAHGVTKSYKKVVDGTTYILAISYWLTDYLVSWYRLFPVPNESKMKKTEKKSEGFSLELIDTIKVPQWLWNAYNFDDTTDLEDDEIKKLDAFKEEYKFNHLDDRGEEAYFSSHNDFDSLGGNVYDVDVYKRSDMPTEKKNEAYVDVIESPGARKIVKTLDWTCKKCGKPGARIADYDKDGNRVPGFFCNDCYKKMLNDEKSESIKDFPTNTGYKFTFGFQNPKTANVAMNVAKEKGYAYEQGRGTGFDDYSNVSIWVKEPQDAIRFADAIVNVANGENGVSLERSDVDKAFALAVKNNAGYKENKDAIDTAASQYALSIRPTESFDGLFILGELTDAVDFLEEIK